MSNEESSIPIEHPAISTPTDRGTIIENKSADKKVLIKVEPLSPAPTSSECTEQPNESVETKDDKSKLVAGTESGKAVNKSNNNVTRSKNVPHTYLTMPDGKKIMFSLPTKTSNPNNTGNYGERLKYDSSTESPTKKTVSGYGFSQRGIKFVALSVLCCLIGILFYLLATDAGQTARLLVLLIGTGLGAFFLLCSNDHVCR
ncbi:hypothetical protein ACHWQZ_G000806 [Mnemiopsis leidyi]